MYEVLNIEGIECYEKDGVAYLKLETVARGLGFTQEKNGVEYVRWETVSKYLEELHFPNKLGKEDFIPENIFYRLAMKAKNETAEKFQAKVADDIIPSIRKHGGYIAGQERMSDSELIEKVAAAVQKIITERGRADKGDECHYNPFNPGESVDKQRIKKLNKLAGRVSKLCGLKKNKTLHYLYKTVEENLGIDIDSYSEVYRKTSGDGWDSTMDVVCKYDNLYQEAVRLCEETIERKHIFG